MDESLLPTKQTRTSLPQRSINSPQDGGAFYRSPSPRFAAIRFAIVALWWWTAASQMGRIHLVYSYSTIATLPSLLEPFGAPVLGLVGSLLLAVGYYLLADRVGRGTRESQQSFTRSDRILLLASMPSFLSVLRSVAPERFPATIWEPIWLSGWTGLAWCILIGEGTPVRSQASEASASGTGWNHRVWRYTALAFPMVLCLWWIWQSESAYQSFLLGFNDGGHFAQRVANTAEGRGFLLESPVLPPFWDHFNPGLLLFVPVWWIVPDIRIFFVAQPLAFAVSGWLIYGMARRMEGTRGVSAIWSVAWMLHPSVGQMNLAYTYSWHPIVFAIPFLLGSMLLLLQPSAKSSFSRLGAILCAIVACSFEEGVIVVVGCFAAAMGLRALWRRASLFDQQRDVDQIRAWQWGCVWFVSIVSFLVVYHWSGLAPFQSARFARLGGTTFEILLSPLWKPSEFFGLLGRPRNLPFLAIWFLPGLIGKGWRVPWTWLAMAPPFLVLLVWEHQPAQSIAFQYTACLLPLLYFGSIADATDSRSPGALTGWATGATVSAMVLSFYFGQLPWSQQTLLDVQARTYGQEDASLRQRGGEDSEWALEQIESLRASGELRVLATGRIAMHFVGCRDLETVGQFWQRRKDLVEHFSDLQDPVLAYDLVFLDRNEEFQQTREETDRLREEMKKWGFQRIDSQHGFEIYRQAPAP